MASGAVPDSSVIHSEMEIIYAAPVFCTVVGAQSQDQRVGLSLTDIVMPEYHAALREQVT